MRFYKNDILSKAGRDINMTLYATVIISILLLLLLLWMCVHKWELKTSGFDKIKAPLRIIPMLPNESQNKADINSALFHVKSMNLEQNYSRIQGKPTIIKKIPKVNESPRKLHTVTYASHGGRDDRFCRAVESAIRHEYDLVILGWKVPWRGLSQKLEAAQSYAASLPPNDLLLFTDAFDVLFTDRPKSIIEQFEKSNSSILFSAECGCWPHIMEDRAACFTKYPKSPTPYRYLNSGTWIGTASMATKMLAEVIREAGKNFGNANDQKLVADMFISGRYGIQLDYYNTIFQSMHMTLDPPLPHCDPREDMILTSEDRWRNSLTKSMPAVIHFNGGGKRHHLAMESRIWYKRKEYNTPSHRIALANYQLNVPSAIGGKLAFSDICKDYLSKG